MKQPEINCSYDELRAAITLQPHPRNPNTHSDEQIKLLAKIIQHQGWRNPVVVSKLSGFIVAGHGRLKAAELLGLDEVPVDLQDFKTEADELAHLVADNRIAELSEINRATLADIIADLDTGEIDLELTGFELPDLEELMTAEHPGQGLTDDDEAPEPPEQPVTVEGDIWLLGDHRLMCGDSTSVDDVNKLMDGVKPDLIHTDPPYGMNAVSNSAVLTKSYGTDIMGDDTPDVAKDAFQLINGLYPNAKQIWWGANYYCSVLPDSECWLVWDKNNGASDQTDCELAWANFRSVVRQFTQASEKTNRVHPTQKPVSLMEWIIQRFNLSAKTIADYFGGSGSTLIAAEKHGLRCFIMEFDPKYCDVIINRWQDFTGKKATHAETGRKFETH